MDINKTGSGQPPTQGTSSKQARSTQQAGVSVTSPDSSTESRTDTLTVTQEAARLIKLEQQLLSTSAPAVDSSKVNNIRQQLESGTYTVDSTTIAEALLASEKGLI